MKSIFLLYFIQFKSLFVNSNLGYIIIIVTLVYGSFYKILKDYSWNVFDKQEGLSNIVKYILQYIYKVYLINIFIVLYLTDNITINRVLKFIIVILLIITYQYLINLYLKKVDKMILLFDKYEINKKLKIFEILIKIHKYKNPILLILIKLESNLFKLIYSVSRYNIKPIYITTLYNILYNVTALNGCKIILYRYYVILRNWIHNTIYELFFKRLYGLILNILIFTNIIDLILEYLKSSSWLIMFLKIYIFLILIGVIIEYFDNKKGDCKKFGRMITSIEYNRLEFTITGILISKMHDSLCQQTSENEFYELVKLINKNANAFFGFIDIYAFKFNYKNFLYYQRVSCLHNTSCRWGLENANKPSFFMYLELISAGLKSASGLYHPIEHIVNIIQSNSIPNEINIKLLKFHLLTYELLLYYIWDIEQAIGIKDTYFRVTCTPAMGNFALFDYTINTNREPYVDPYSYLEDIYVKNISNIKLDKFGNLSDNIEFYEKFYNYIFFHNYRYSEAYQKLDINLYPHFCCDDDTTLLNNQLDIGRKNGCNSLNNENLRIKYEMVFKELSLIKKELHIRNFEINNKQ